MKNRNRTHLKFPHEFALTAKIVKDYKGDESGWATVAYRIRAFSWGFFGFASLSKVAV